MDSSKGVSKGIIIGSFIILLLAVGIIVGAFYIHNIQPVAVEEEILDGGKLSLTYTDEKNLFIIENATPTSDVVGTKFDSAELFFDFTVSTELVEANYVEYEVILVKDENVSTSKNENIKVYLEKQKSGTYTKVADPVIFTANVDDEELGTNAMSVHTQKKMSSGNDNYRLRLWVSDKAVFNTGDIQNFGVKIAIKGVAK